MSGTNSKINIAISSSDTVAKQVAEITKQLDKLKTPAERAGEAVGKFADPKKISSLASGMMDVSRASFGAFINVSRMVAPLGALTSAASLAGLAKMTQQWADAGVQLGTSATRARMGVDQLAKWQGAAYLAGSSSEALTAGVIALNDSLTKAANGTSPQAIMAFGALGMSFRNADGSVRNATDAFPELIQRLHNLQNPTIRAERATDLLSGAASGLEPVINGGADAFRRYTEEATRANSMTAHQVDVARDFQHSQRGAEMAIRGLANSIEEKTAPSLGRLLDKMTAWVEGTDAAGKSNRDLVANDVAGWANKQIDVISKVGDVIDKTVRSTIGWDHALQGLEFALAGKGIARLLGLKFPVLPALGGLAAHEGMAALDPNDRMGGWIDRNLPGASWFDDWMARHTGLGRTYGDQAGSDMVEALERALGAVGAATAGARGGARRALPATPLGPAPPAGGGLWDWLGQHLNPFGSAHAAERPIGRNSTAALPPEIPGTASDRGAMLRNVQQFGGALGVPPALLWGLYDAESGYGTKLTSPAGAQGAFQFMPKTAERFGVDVNSPGSSARGAAQYMAWLRDHYGGDWRKAIAAYNWGEGNLDKEIAQYGADWLKHLPRETQRELRVVGQHFDYDRGAGIPGQYPGGPGATVPAGGGKDGYGDAHGMTDYGGFLGLGSLMHNKLPHLIDQMLRHGPSGPPVHLDGGSGSRQTGSNDTTLSGQASLHVKLEGFPPGTRTTASTEGDLFKEGGPIRIQQIGVGRTA